MSKFARKSGLAAIVAVASLTASFTVASAQDYQLRVGPNGVRIHDNDRDVGRGRGRCNLDDAIDAARDEGFRRPHVARVTDRSVVVEGFTRRGPDRMRFANVRGCPEL